MFGPYWWVFWLVIGCNVLSPQFLWFNRFSLQSAVSVRHSLVIKPGDVAGAVHDRGGELEPRLFAVVVGMYHGTIWDWPRSLVPMGLFVFLLFLFIRFLPMISIAEMRGLLPEARRVNDEHEAREERR